MTVLGLELSSDSSGFLTTLSFHVLAAITCVVTGIVAMLSAKAPGRHPTAGTIYYWCLLVVFLSATVLAAMRWHENYPLFILGALAFSAAWTGRRARQRQAEGWLRVHITGMAVSYVVLLTAFYVASGKKLPFWRDLPPIVYWLLPSAIGIPLIVRALIRHPLVARAAKAAPRSPS